MTGLVGDMGRPSKDRTGWSMGCPATLPEAFGCGTKDIVFGSTLSPFSAENRKGPVKMGLAACKAARLGATSSGFPRRQGPMGGAGCVEG